MHAETDEPRLALLERIGRVPLPPYIRHGEMLPADRERYQTVYARQPGAVAAPTAGLHFTPELLRRLEEQKIGTCFVTLHVGLDTFRPIAVEHSGGPCDAQRMGPNRCGNSRGSPIAATVEAAWWRWERPPFAVLETAAQAARRKLGPADQSFHPSAIHVSSGRRATDKFSFAQDDAARPGPYIRRRRLVASCLRGSRPRAVSFL